jgi:hypothetical protein
MSLAIQLFGYLILTFLGFVVPVISILLSVFQDGILKLTVQYENEKSQSEGNIKEQLKKIGEAKQPDVIEIEQSLRKLKIMKKIAEARLSYLNPKMQILRLTIPLLFSFSGVVLALVLKSRLDIMLSLLMSLICFTYMLYVLWVSLNIIIEVKKIVDADRDNYHIKITELLSSLVQKDSRAQLFLSKIYINFNGIDIKDETTVVHMIPNRKVSIAVGIKNIERRMAKQVEIGFIFPLDFIIEKTSAYSIYTDTERQIVRYQIGFIQGDTYQILSPLSITPLKEGSHKILTFIKAENIEATDRNLTINVK